MREPSGKQKVEASAVILWDELKRKERDGDDAELPPKGEHGRPGAEKEAPAGKHPSEHPE